MATETSKKNSAPADASSVPKDPIEHGSLLWPAFLSVVALLISGAWALYDEGFVRRPYKRIQKDWVHEIAPKAYDGLRANSAKDSARILASDEYKSLKTAADAASAAVAPTKAALQDELVNAVLPRIKVLSEPVKVAKSEAAAFVYRAEHAGADGDTEKQRRYLNELKKVKDRQVTLRFPGEEKPVSWNYDQMTSEFTRLKQLQGDLQGQMAAVGRAADEAKARLDEFVKRQSRAIDPAALDSLDSGLDSFIYEVKQIHVKTGTGPGEEFVDRCETCHLGVRSPVELTLADVQGRKEFTSHPHPELLKTHDPERFGCSPCHGGNGIGLTSIEKAHGRYKHWLWPLPYKENIEAGCVQCHQTDQFLTQSTTLNQGREIFFERGCWGCHPYKGFNPEADELKSMQQALASTVERMARTEIEVGRLTEVAENSDSSPEQVEAAYAKTPAERQKLHLAATERVEIEKAIAGLKLETKKVGPNLNEVTTKLKPEWLVPWLLDPRAFRPDTKMPRFRLDNEQALAVAAYLWQNAKPAALRDAEEGDPENGQKLLITRGCLACHQVETDEFELIGNDFAANLSRVGEKATFDYLASWIQNPKLHNSMATMPNLRLSDQDARDIAAWLVTKKAEGATYSSSEQALTFLTNKALFGEGERLVKHLGCAGCHQINGLEAEGVIGVELTQEGSKPLERLDFGTQTHAFKHMQDPRHEDRHSQYDHKGFFENKLRNPEIWDKGRMFASWFDRTRMPSFWPRPDEPGYAENKAAIEQDIDAVTTFILGSVDAAIPPALQFAPQGLQKDLRDGWWVVKKYNCQGCHQILPGETPPLWNLPIYQDGAGFEGVPGLNGRPPTLVGQGSRVDPDWFSNFLANPALTDDPEAFHGNGVRKGLMVRMPTYDLSERERSKLVRFFAAMAKLTDSYSRPLVAKLKGDELDVARAVFTGGDCSNCHLLGGEVAINPETTYAPSFEPLAARIRPTWTKKWITEPNSVIPGTAMPAIFEKNAAGQWKIKPMNETAKGRLGPDLLAKLAAYEGDHADLLVRYFAAWDEDEAAFHRMKRAETGK